MDSQVVFILDLKPSVCNALGCEVNPLGRLFFFGSSITSTLNFQRRRSEGSRKNNYLILLFVKQLLKFLLIMKVCWKSRKWRIKLFKKHQTVVLSFLIGRDNSQVMRTLDRLKLISRCRYDYSINLTNFGMILGKDLNRFLSKQTTHFWLICFVLVILPLGYFSVFGLAIRCRKFWRRKNNSQPVLEVLVKWSACSPSTPSIRVWIPLKCSVLIE